MKVEIKYMFHIEKKTKEGKPYKLVWCLVTIGGQEEVRRFAVWN